MINNGLFNETFDTMRSYKKSKGQKKSSLLIDDWDNMSMELLEKLYREQEWEQQQEEDETRQQQKESKLCQQQEAELVEIEQWENERIKEPCRQIQ